MGTQVLGSVGGGRGPRFMSLGGCSEAWKISSCSSLWVIIQCFLIMDYSCLLDAFVGRDLKDHPRLFPYGEPGRDLSRVTLAGQLRTELELSSLPVFLLLHPPFCFMGAVIAGDASSHPQTAHSVQVLLQGLPLATPDPTWLGPSATPLLSLLQILLVPPPSQG